MIITSNERESRSDSNSNVVEEEEEQLDFEGFTEFISGYSLDCEKQKEIYVCQLSTFQKTNAGRPNYIQTILEAVFYKAGLIICKL